MNKLTILILQFLLVFTSSCISNGDELQISVKSVKGNEANSNSGQSSDNSSNQNQQDELTDTSDNGSSNSIDESSDTSTLENNTASTNDTSSSEESNGVAISLLFDEDFESGVLDSSKWSTYQSSNSVNPAISMHNGSNAWGATSTFSLWGASIITQQTFNLPITIEWDHDIDASYNNSLLREGLCIYSTLATRSTHHFSPESGSDFGCVYIKYNSSRDGNRPVFIPHGLFMDLANPHPDLVNYHDGTVFGGVRFANLYLNYRITVSIATDLSYTVTVQFKDGGGAAPFIYEDSLTGTPENFHLEFNNADRDQKSTFYDNIKVTNGVVEPTPIN